jgi:hypothetical protein
MSQPTEQQLQKFVKEVMKIERRYGNEKKNEKSNRQNDVREYVDKFAAKELDDENPQGKVR